LKRQGKRRGTRKRVESKKEEYRQGSGEKKMKKLGMYVIGLARKPKKMNYHLDILVSYDT